MMMEMVQPVYGCMVCGVLCMVVKGTWSHYRVHIALIAMAWHAHVAVCWYNLLSGAHMATAQPKGAPEAEAEAHAATWSWSAAWNWNWN